MTTVAVCQEFGIRSANPLLTHIEDMLIEEASAEEDEYMGRNAQNDDKKTVNIERDAHMLKVGTCPTTCLVTGASCSSC